MGGASRIENHQCDLNCAGRANGARSIRVSGRRASARRATFAKRHDNTPDAVVRRLAASGASWHCRPATLAGIENWAVAARRVCASTSKPSGDPARGSNADVCMHAAGVIRSPSDHRLDDRAPRRAGRDGDIHRNVRALLIDLPAGEFAGNWSVLDRRSATHHRAAVATPRMAAPLGAGRCGAARSSGATRDQVERRPSSLLEQTAEDGDALHRADRLAAAWHKVLWESLMTLEAPRLARFWAIDRGARRRLDPQRDATPIPRKL